MARGKGASGSSALVEPGVKELKQSVRRIQALMDEAPIGICNIDLKGKITYVNKRFEEVSGYSGEEVVGKNGFKLGMFSNEAVKLLAKRMKDRLTGRAPRLLEAQFKCKDGHWIWVSMEGKVIRERGVPVGFQIISRDITELRKAEEALRESREQLRKMFESVTDGLSVIDLNGVITETNQRTAEMHGFSSKDELPGKSALEMVAPRDHERIAKNMRQALKQGVVRGVEYTLLRADGTEFPGELSTSVLRDASGKPVGHITIARDITERKQVEEALQAEKNKLQSVIDAMEYGLTIQDKDYNIIYQNEPQRVTFGDHLGDKCYRVYEGNEKVCDECPVEKAFKDGKSHTSERRSVLPSGEVTFWENTANPVRDASGKIVSCLEITRNITERRQAEEELKLRAQVLDGATDSIFLHDFDGNFIYVNETACRTHDYSREELMKMKLNQVIAPERVGRLYSDFQEMAEKGQVIFESAHLRKGGSIMPVEVHGRTIKSGGRKLLLTVIRDITERKRMEEELKEAREKLIRSERLAAIGQLASGVGHELRNPLGAIKNAVLYIRRKITRSELLAHTEPKVLEFLDLIDEEIDSANKVITDLLSFSRVAKPAVSLVNVSSIIKDALNHVAMSENVELTTDVDPSLPLVMVDASQIRQVFINLILNALEAMPEGGRFEIRAKKGKAEFVMVEFTDTGCGIPASVAAKIFDPLFTTKPRGIGLGLAMSRSIVERHGGDIGVKSKEGKGTTFTLSLPIRVV